MPTQEERRAAVEAFAEALEINVSILDQMIPTRPWQDVLPPEVWLRQDILQHRDERKRLSFFDDLRDAIGATHAETLMDYLPPVPWVTIGRLSVDNPSVTASD